MIVRTRRCGRTRCAPARGLRRHVTETSTSNDQPSWTAYVSACVLGVDRELKKPCFCECRFAMLLAFILIKSCFPTRLHTSQTRRNASRPRRAWFSRTGGSRCNLVAMSAVCVEYSRRNELCPGAGLSCSRVTSPAVQWFMYEETYPGWAGLSHHENSWRTRSTLLAYLAGLWGPHQLDPGSWGDRFHIDVLKDHHKHHQDRCHARMLIA